MEKKTPTPANKISWTIIGQPLRQEERNSKILYSMSTAAEADMNAQGEGN